MQRLLVLFAIALPGLIAQSTGAIVGVVQEPSCLTLR